MWNEINSQNDLDIFMNMFGHFHDSCMKEFQYISGAFVCEDLSMYPINNKRILKVIFQRQESNRSVIEMEFIGLRQLNIYPIDENYTCEIFAATMVLSRNCVYWYDCHALSESDLTNYKGALISSLKVRWRVADEYIGDKEVYAAI